MEKHIQFEEKELNTLLCVTNTHTRTTRYTHKCQRQLSKRDREMCTQSIVKNVGMEKPQTFNAIIIITL